MLLGKNMNPFFKRTKQAQSDQGQPRTSQAGGRKASSFYLCMKWHCRDQEHEHSFPRQSWILWRLQFPQLLWTPWGHRAPIQNPECAQSKAVPWPKVTQGTGARRVTQIQALAHHLQPQPSSFQAHNALLRAWGSNMLQEKEPHLLERNNCMHTTHSGGENSSVGVKPCRKRTPAVKLSSILSILRAKNVAFVTYN